MARQLPRPARTSTPGSGPRPAPPSPGISSATSFQPPSSISQVTPLRTRTMVVAVPSPADGRSFNALMLRSWIFLMSFAPAIGPPLSCQWLLRRLYSTTSDPRNGKGGPRYRPPFVQPFAARANSSLSVPKPLARHEQLGHPRRAGVPARTIRLRPAPRLPRRPGSARRPCGRTRSEEHTSELQSRLHLVCRLLLEKKT